MVGWWTGREQRKQWRAMEERVNNMSRNLYIVRNVKKATHSRAASARRDQLLPNTLLGRLEAVPAPRERNGCATLVL